MIGGKLVRFDPNTTGGLKECEQDNKDKKDNQGRPENQAINQPTNELLCLEVKTEV